MNCNSNVNEQFRKSVLVSVDDVGQIIETVNEESLLLGQVVYQVRLTVEKNKYYTIPSCVPAFDRIFSLELTPKLELTISGVPGIVVRTMLSTTKLA